MVKGEKINPSDYEGTVFKHYSIPAYDKYGTYLEEMGETIKSEKYVVTNTDILVSK